MSNMNKAQLQLMESALVLVALVIILSIAFIYYTSIKNLELQQRDRDLKDLDAISAFGFVIRMPELRCESGYNCYDVQKIKLFPGQVSLHKDYYESMLGNVFIKIRQYEVSPGIEGWENEWVIYNKTTGSGYTEIQMPVLLKDGKRNKLGIIYLGVYK